MAGEVLDAIRKNVQDVTTLEVARLALGQAETF